MRWNLIEVCSKIFEPSVYSDIEDICKNFKSLTFTDKSEKALLDELDIYNSLVEQSDEIINMLELALYIDNANEELKQRHSAAEQMNLCAAEQKNILSLMYADNRELFSYSGIMNKYKGFLRQLEENISVDKNVLDTVEAMSITGSKAWRKFHNYNLNKTQAETGASLGVLQNQIRSSSKDEAAAAFEKTKETAAKAAPASLEALNNIKGEFIYITDLYKKESPLSFSLEKNILDKELFSAYIALTEKAGKESLELLSSIIDIKDFRIFSLDRIEQNEVSGIKMEYSECIDIVKSCFAETSKILSELLNEAVRLNLIDNEPRDGKRAGACMQAVHSIGKSFILSNDAGSVRAVISLAHEFGHVFHHKYMFRHPILETYSPMIINECISKLSELILFDYLIQNEIFPKNIIIEMWLKNFTQTTCQTYSRFLFEDEFFRIRKTAPLTLEQANNLMAESQIRAYNGFLDKKNTNPFEWVIKPHYYYTDIPYYNYQYIIGYLTALLIFRNLKNNLLDFEKIGYALQESGRLKDFIEFFELLGITVGDLSDSKVFSLKNILNI